VPLTLHALYRASLTHIELAAEEFQSAEWEGDLQALKDVLAFIQRRWALAGEFALPCCNKRRPRADGDGDAGRFLAEIQEAYDKKARERNPAAKESPVVKRRAQWRSGVDI
jgi:hypothetical protein